MLDENHVWVCLEPVNSTSVACDVRAFVLYEENMQFDKPLNHILKVMDGCMHIFCLVSIKTHIIRIAGIAGIRIAGIATASVFYCFAA